MNFLQPIPTNEEELYAALPAKVRQEFDNILQHLDFILGAKSTAAACRDAIVLGLARYTSWSIVPERRSRVSSISRSRAELRSALAMRHKITDG